MLKLNGPYSSLGWAVHLDLEHDGYVIGIQGAFSANRFIPNEGVEGSPYENYKDWGTKVVLTTSSYDMAVPIARHTSGASHVGGKHGISVAKKHPDIFNIMNWNGNAHPSLPNDKVILGKRISRTITLLFQLSAPLQI